MKLEEKVLQQLREKMPVADYCGQKLLSKRCFGECLVLPCQS